MTENNSPYNKGGFISSPFLNYLMDNKYYELWGSREDYYGIMLKDFHDIKKGCIVRLENLSVDLFRLTAIIEHNYSPEKIESWSLGDDDFDYSFFENAKCEKYTFSMKPIIINDDKKVKIVSLYSFSLSMKDFFPSYINNYTLSALILSSLFLYLKNEKYF